jgi:Rieske Fe-S protein
MTAINRRRALTGSAAIAVGVPVLAACSSDDEPSTDASSSTSPSPSDESPSSPSADGTETPSAGGSALASVADVPVGGCFVVASAKVVVTQPTEGDFKAFTAVCTHQGCIVGKVENGEILCPCHGSAFSATDGSVVNGPATEPLAEQPITVKGDQISLA